MIRISGSPCSSHVAHGCWSSRGGRGGRQVERGPHGFLPGSQHGPAPGDRQRSHDLQAVAGLGLGVGRCQRRRRAGLVGDHADQPAGLQAPAQLDAGAAVRAAVADRVGGKFGGDDDGVLDQRAQAPAAQCGGGELARRPGRLRHRRQRDALAQPRGAGLRRRRPGRAGALVRGLRRSHLTSLVHGWTTVPDVGRVRRRSAHQLRCHFRCADASALAQETEHAIFARATAPGGLARFRPRAAETDPSGVGAAAESDELWILFPAARCPPS